MAAKTRRAPRIGRVLVLWVLSTGMAAAAVLSPRSTSMPWPMSMPRPARVEPAPAPVAAAENPRPESVGERAPVPLEPVVVPAPEPVSAPELLIAVAKQTLVYEAPRFDSRRLGYLRHGTRVERRAEPEGFDGCRGGWYRIRPEGFVCVGKTATLDPKHPVAGLAMTRARRAEPLPYLYAMSRPVPSPFYSRVPSPKQQRAAEPDLAHHLGLNSAYAWRDLPRGPIPELLRDGGPAPVPLGYAQSKRGLTAGRVLPRSGVAFLDLFESEGRAFGLTTELWVMPLDRFTPVVPSEFHGVELTSTGLPVVFVRAKSASLYTGDPEAGGLSFERMLEYREALPITGRRVVAGSRAYLETRSGHFVLDANLVRIDPLPEPPHWAKTGQKWIDISIANQTLVAYEGEAAVYATLVSTGVDGAGDPETTRSTVVGQFRIFAKHVTSTMQNAEIGDEFDLREVPYVQYFKEGYALHAAYWHDAFGRPRSHGCVNLSPIDARFLFHFTDPAVPRVWHGAMSALEGTRVNVTP